MILVVRPQLARLGTWYRKRGLSPELLAVLLVGLFLSAYITERIGIHQIFGAFFFGAIMPREETAEMFHEVLERIESLTLLLVPPGVLHRHRPEHRHRATSASKGLWQLALILLVAIAGKFIGAAAAARAQGLAPARRRRSACS